MAKSERDEIRDAHAGAPGIGHHIERLLGERANAVTHGDEDRVAAADRQLEGFGHISRERAAADRKAAAEQRDTAAGSGGEAVPKRTPPAGRRAPQRDKT